MILMHTFHIPVMGLAFTIDTPVKAAPYGISSVISIVDDGLIEKMREYYCNKIGLPYSFISEKVKDSRAERITNYLNLIHHIVTEKFEEVKDSIRTKGEDIYKLIEMLPDYSEVKKKFHDLVESGNVMKQDIQNWLNENIHAGNIDVNIMTKVDNENFHGDEKLPIEFNDAHAALRGFAKSKLNSSLVLSAGMNPRLYSYIEKFEDFYPDINGYLPKKITLKVSDYRSAIIQGKFLAKKGLWVSEYRIESGLNCGGHAFASDGFLLGPILEEFKNNRAELIEITYDIYVKALTNKNRFYPALPPSTKITAQGGVGTSKEHNFLLNYYQLDSVGWGTPFLLVPEVTNVDTQTLELLRKAREEDLYLSNISPLGVPFNSIRNNSQDVEKIELVNKGRPGSSCPKKFLTFNNEFTKESICTASRQYQFLKIKELDDKNLDESTRQIEFNKIVDKTCICVGLGNAALLNNNIEIKGKSIGVSVCPGPNMAYFDKILSLKQMVDHIYGRKNFIDETNRPNFFIKELKLYINYLKRLISECGSSITEKQAKYFELFAENLSSGIEYYRTLYLEQKDKYRHFKDNFLDELEILSNELKSIFQENLVISDL
ncbi:MAG TPA: hypothetical protein PKA80_03195 [Ignavibacteriaceae bacterium]|nr:hypothetical protein [Ignavibacteriaceae bacterium]